MIILIRSFIQLFFKVLLLFVLKHKFVQFDFVHILSEVYKHVDINWVQFCPLCCNSGATSAESSFRGAACALNTKVFPNNLKQISLEKFSLNLV